MTYRDNLAEKQTTFQKESESSDIIDANVFKTKNITYEKYRNLSKDDRKFLHLSAYEENKNWITENIKKYHAAWLVVIDGEIFAFSKSLDDYPSDQEIQEICNKTKKFPFIFVNNDILAVEEKAIKWKEWILDCNIPLLHQSSTPTFH